jgi:hypothetical protein
MAQSNGIGEVIQFALLGVGAWIAWNIYEAYVLGQSSVTAPATPAVPATPATPAPSSTPSIVIPANFSVTSDINNSYKGQVTYNGSPATFNVIIANAGASSGVVYNSSGQDVTALLGAANVQTLVNAYQAAVNTETVAGTLSGFSGLGQFIRVPSPVFPRRVIRVPVVMPGRRREFV